MLGLIVGGAGSGKSEYAERLAVRLAEEAEGPLIYLATMIPGSREAGERIEKHRKNRSGRGFRTIERGTGLADLDLGQSRPTVLPENLGQSRPTVLPEDLGQSRPTVLLEDLGNLLGNEMFLEEGAGPEVVLRGIRHIEEQAAHLLIVGNEVFSGGSAYEGETGEYLKELALIQCALAERAAFVAEAVCGCVLVHKGEKIGQSIRHTSPRLCPDP